jgi:hypothetical protein
LEVERDFARDPGGWRPPRAGTDTLASCVGAPGSSAGRFLRTVACALAPHPAFHRVLTPDFDRDHYNHFHLEAYPDGAPPLVAGVVERSSTRSGLYWSPAALRRAEQEYHKRASFSTTAVVLSDQRQGLVADAGDGAVRVG